jgi:hypothetical protein
MYISLLGLGSHITSAPNKSFLQISACPGPNIVVHPKSAVFPYELKKIFSTPSKIYISPRSTLIVEGMYFYIYVCVNMYINVHMYVCI